MYKTNAIINSDYGRGTWGCSKMVTAPHLQCGYLRVRVSSPPQKSDRGLSLETGPCTCVYGVTVNQKTD